MPVNQKRLARASFQLGSASSYTQLTRWQYANSVPSRAGDGFIPFSLLRTSRYAIATNDNSVQPTPPPPPPDPPIVPIVPIVMAAGGQGGIFASVDGNIWVRATIDWDNCTAIAYGGGKWVAAGNKGSSNYFAVSTDGVQWTIINSTVGQNCNALAYGNGTWLGACTDVIIYSETGTTWQTVGGFPFNSEPILTVIFAGEIFLAGTLDGIFTSLNGRDWITPTTGISGNVYAIAAYEISGTGYVYLASNLSDPSVLYISSDNGDNWSGESSLGMSFTDQAGMPVPPTTLGIRFNTSTADGIIIAGTKTLVNLNQIIQTRIVGNTPSLTVATTTAGISYLNELTYYSGRWFGAGNNKIIVSNDDGANWVGISTALTSVLTIASKV